MQIDASTPLVDVLRIPKATEILTAEVPSVVRSTLLHTFQRHPVGLILATEEGVSENDRERIIAELAAVDTSERPTPAPRLPAPSRLYEPAGTTTAEMTYEVQVEVWQRFEIRIDGPRHGNPYLEVELTARFFDDRGHGHDVLGFYDGDGVHIVRFLPPVAGEWRFELKSNARSLDGLAGDFQVRDGGRRGPVRVSEDFHFAYATGETYLPIGTTCYVWTHQEPDVQERTLASLAESPFNKLRMCVFPKSYTFNSNDPERYPFTRTQSGWDPEQFDPQYWRHLEDRIDRLEALGIEADLILFHAYDRWGFSSMDPATDDRYVRYVVARLSAFRNVWWSLANEYDLMPSKSDDDWERWAGIIRQWDATDHLRSIHNWHVPYDHSRPWITHVSMQRLDVHKTAEMTTEWRDQWRKPVVVDECAYEGDIDQGWGNITGEEMTRRFWEGALRGGYIGHGETYRDPDEILWWAKGGELRGDSPARIGLLATIMAEAPNGRLEPLDLEWDVLTAGVPGQQLLYYFGIHRPSFRRLFHDPLITWEVDVIDTWEMTVMTLPGTYRGRFEVELPGKPYIALRLRAVEQ